MVQRTRPICQRCGVQDNLAHRAGFLHRHFPTIKRMIESGYGNAAIIRAIGLDPDRGSPRAHSLHPNALGSTWNL